VGERAGESRGGVKVGGEGERNRERRGMEGGGRGEGGGGGDERRKLWAGWGGGRAR